MGWNTAHRIPAVRARRESVPAPGRLQRTPCAGTACQGITAPKISFLILILLYPSASFMATENAAVLEEMLKDYHSKQIAQPIHKPINKLHLLPQFPHICRHQHHLHTVQGLATRSGPSCTRCSQKKWPEVLPATDAAATASVVPNGTTTKQAKTGNKPGRPGEITILSVGRLYEKLLSPKCHKDNRLAEQSHHLTAVPQQKMEQRINWRCQAKVPTRDMHALWASWKVKDKPSFCFFLPQRGNRPNPGALRGWSPNSALGNAVRANWSAKLQRTPLALQRLFNHLLGEKDCWEGSGVEGGMWLGWGERDPCVAELENHSTQAFVYMPSNPPGSANRAR
ncbi:hypothetical protein JD844_033720 [Phrynosoma platyrhinos]|uniref:Uncharacterized protein n=1 Tax=Phrynosoma platyrhinos TaxID=52577 RepID=A0ABQ7T6A4_PHRPL|nr:hypothetical protein JD844_033720 [Phrynosoma platyrhinos]